MSSIGTSSVAWLRVRLRMYATRRYALLVALALIHLGLLVASAWLVATQMTSGAVQVFAVGLLAVMAAVVVLWPGSAAALVFIVGCGGCYLLLSAMESAIGTVARAPHPYEVLGLAAALYLVHAVDALREVLPGNVALESAVLIRWVRRVAEALVPGLLLGGLLVVAPTAAAGGTFWLVGALGLLLAVGLPALALRPRPWSDHHHQDR